MWKLSPATKHATKSTSVLVIGGGPEFASLSDVDFSTYSKFYPSSRLEMTDNPREFLQIVSEGFEIVHLLCRLSDPFSIWGGVNVFSYVHNNPVSLYDPLGMMSWNYNVNYHSVSWVDNGDFVISFPSDVGVDVTCECIGNGKYKGTVTVTFDISIYYGTQGQLKHENGHLDIFKNYFNGLTRKYSEKYERIYNSEEECFDAHRAIYNDLRKDWGGLGPLETAHEDWFQDAVQWIFNQFIGK